MRSVTSILLAGVTAAAVALAGCGASTGQDESAARQSAAARQVDRVCADLATRRDAIRTLTQDTQRPAVTARAYAAMAEITVDQAAALGDVAVRAGAGTPELRRYLTAVRRDGTLAWRVRRAVAEGDLNRAKLLVESATQAAAGTRALARAAGLRVCGERA